MPLQRSYHPNLRRKNQRYREVNECFEDPLKCYQVEPGFKPKLMWQQHSESFPERFFYLKSWSAKSWNSGLWHHRYAKSSCQYHLSSMGPCIFWESWGSKWEDPSWCKPHLWWGGGLLITGMIAFLSPEIQASWTKSFNILFMQMEKAFSISQIRYLSGAFSWSFNNLSTHFPSLKQFYLLVQPKPSPKVSGPNFGSKIISY